MELERDVLQLARDRDVVGAQRDVGSQGCAPVGAVVLAVLRAADHQGLEPVGVLLVDGSDVFAVAQDRDAVGHAHDDVHVVVDHDDAVAVVAHAVDHLKELVAAILREGRGGLIDDEDLGVEPGGLHDLDELALLEGVVLDRVAALSALLLLRNGYRLRRESYRRQVPFYGRDSKVYRS